MDNDTVDSMTELPDTYTGILLILLSFIGVFENGCVIYVFLRSKHVHDTTMKIIMNLAVTDVTTAFALGIDGTIILHGLVSKTGCFVILISLIYMIFVSEMVLLITTFDRYIAICHQVRYANIMTQKTLFKLLAVAWLLPLPILLIQFLGFNNWELISVCSYTNLLHEWIYVTNSTVIVFLMSATSVFYVQILKKAREFHLRFRPAQIHGVNAASMRVRLRRRAIKNGEVMGIVTLAFIICWLPFHIYQFQFGLNFKGNSLIIMITGALGNLNFIINPFLYAWQKQDFRIEAKKMFPCWKNTHRVTDNTGNNISPLRGITSRTTIQHIRNNIDVPPVSLQRQVKEPQKKVTNSRLSPIKSSASSSKSLWNRDSKLPNTIIEVKPCPSSLPEVDI